MKMKLFRSYNDIGIHTAVHRLEFEINDWLAKEKNINIHSVYQSESVAGEKISTTISILYRELDMRERDLYDRKQL